jgi:hypothetical protein
LVVWQLPRKRTRVIIVDTITVADTTTATMAVTAAIGIGTTVAVISA